MQFGWRRIPVATPVLSMLTNPSCLSALIKKGIIPMKGLAGRETWLHPFLCNAIPAVLLLSNWYFYNFICHQRFWGTDDMRSIPAKDAGKLIMTSDYISPLGRVRYCLSLTSVFQFGFHFLSEWKTKHGTKRSTNHMWRTWWKNMGNKESGVISKD